MMTPPPPMRLMRHMAENLALLVAVLGQKVQNMKCFSKNSPQSGVLSPVPLVNQNQRITLTTAKREERVGSRNA